MRERPDRAPADNRDLLKGQERPLIKAVQELARAVADVDPDPEYAPQQPSAVIVGGYVRDLHLGLHPKDADVEVYGVAPAKLKELLERLFGSTKDVGEAFGIIKIPLESGLELDVSIPRRESKVGKGHTGFLVDSDPSMTIKDAALRRDFTVNALAMDPVTGVVYDPYGGLEDLKNKVLRVTDAERFQDDPLRVLRAMQFIARLGFTVDAKSEELMREMVGRGDLEELARERVTEEFEKLLFKGVRPSVGIKFARKNGIIEAVFSKAHVTNWDDWSNTLDAAVGVRKERCAMLAAFIAGFAPETRKETLAMLTMKKKDLESAAALVTEVERPRDAPTNPANDARKALRRILPADPTSYASFLRALGRGKEGEEFLSLVAEHDLNTETLLQGRDLIVHFGLKPGPQFRQLISEVEAARDRAEIESYEQAIDFVRIRIKSLGDK